MQAIGTLGPSGFRVELKIDNHTIISDEPTDKGGQDQGPAAFSLLGAALAACTAATLRYYANLKQMPLEGVVVEVDPVRRTPAEQNAAGPEAKATLIRKTIKLVGDKLSPEQREKLIAVAEKCPVNRTLLEGVDMEKA
ncbi:MAG: OsmC family protein [Planctomycetes bacterium]|nr:OsmC family protein [Planctomycetota bacterium]